MLTSMACAFSTVSVNCRWSTNLNAHSCQYFGAVLRPFEPRSRPIQHILVNMQREDAGDGGEDAEANLKPEITPPQDQILQGLASSLSELSKDPNEEIRLTAAKGITEFLKVQALMLQSAKPAEGVQLDWTAVEVNPFKPEFTDAGSLKVGSYVTVYGLDVAGLPVTERERTMYVRQDAVILWDEICKADRGIDISGPPGCGKSLEAWAWCCHTSQSKKVLWVHLCQGLSPVIVEMGPNKKQKASAKMDQVIRTLESSDAEVLVVDGLVDEQFDKEVRRALFDLTTKGKFCIAVQSVGFNPNVAILAEFTTTGITVHEMCTWTLEQYKDMCSNVDFFCSVLGYFDVDDEEYGRFIEAQKKKTLPADKMIELVESKYYHAGGSARWMLSRTRKQIEKEVEICLSKIPDVNLLLERRAGIETEANANHLIVKSDVNVNSLVRQVVFFASAYVTERVLTQASATTVTLAYELAAMHSNPAVLGWVAEFDIVAQLERSSREMQNFIYVWAEDKNGKVTKRFLPVRGVNDFDAKSPAASTKEFADGHWMRPIAWNQAGYDLVRLEQKSSKFCVWFYQVARGQGHDFNAAHFVSLIKKLEEMYGQAVVGVEIAFLFPYQKDRGFKRPVISAISSDEASAGLANYQVGFSKDKWVAGKEQTYFKFVGFRPVSPLGAR